MRGAPKADSPCSFAVSAHAALSGSADDLPASSFSNANSDENRPYANAKPRSHGCALFRTPIASNCSTGRTSKVAGRHLATWTHEVDVEKRSRDRGKRSDLQGLAAPVSPVKIGQSQAEGVIVIWKPVRERD